MSAVQLQSELAKIGLGKIVQIGFVVPDLEKAIAQYEPLFGPFKRAGFGVEHASYKGQPRSPYLLEIAFGHSGDLEIELIAWKSGDTPHRDFLEAGRQGMHHVQFRVTETEAWIEKLKRLGYQPIWFDRMSPEVAYVYLERPGDPLIVELLEFPIPDATSGVPGRDN